MSPTKVRGRRSSASSPATGPTPTTPKSAGRQFRSLRRGLFQDENDRSPEKGEIHGRSGTLRRKSSSSSIPEEFRRMMPTSARKAEPEQRQPSQRGVPSIVKSSFYGNSPLSEKRPLKPFNRNSKPDVLRSKSAMKQRSGGRVVKRKVGMNKGVSHAIRKPSKKKIKKLLKKKEMREAKKAAAKEKVKNDFKAKFFEDLEEDEKKLNQRARKSGKLFMTKQTNVSYEIKNGQPVFHLRRSPRKPASPYFKDTTPTVNRSCSKLFTPSGDSDFLHGENSPAGKRRRIPSPVKFDCKDQEDEELNCSVQNIITNLDDDEEECSDMNMSQDDYAVYVNDDELAKVALETANELASIAEPEDTSATIQSILANMKSPTKEEREERRPVTKSRSSGNDKFYPVFSSRVTRSCTNSPAKSKPEKKGVMTSTTSDHPKDGMKQMIIDAGQKVIGAQYCLLCDFIYTAGCQEEEKVHDARHRVADGLIRFPGWRNENIQGDFTDGRIVVVGSADAKRHWEKVDNVLQHVDNVLGICPDDESGSRIRNPGKSKAYLFVADGKVVGFLLAEILDKTDKVSVSSLVSGSKDKQRCLKDVKSGDVVSVGVTRIWVCPTHQRKGIATRLVDAMRRDFLMPAKALKKDEFAFSHTTPNGSEFASKYVGDSSFLVYAPVLPGEM